MIRFLVDPVEPATERLPVRPLADVLDTDGGLDVVGDLGAMLAERD